MANRIAATLSLLAFALCLIVGAVQADNTFVTVVLRAVIAMAGTFVLGQIVGAMAQKMVSEQSGAKDKNEKIVMK